MTPAIHYGNNPSVGVKADVKRTLRKQSENIEPAALRGETLDEPALTDFHRQASSHRPAGSSLSGGLFRHAAGRASKQNRTNGRLKSASRTAVPGIRPDGEEQAGVHATGGVNANRRPRMARESNAGRVSPHNPRASSDRKVVNSCVSGSSGLKLIEHRPFRDDEARGGMSWLGVCNHSMIACGQLLGDSHSMIDEIIPPKLTARQVAVLKLDAAGMDQASMAQVLNLKHRQAVGALLARARRAQEAMSAYIAQHAPQDQSRRTRKQEDAMAEYRDSLVV